MDNLSRSQLNELILNEYEKIYLELQSLLRKTPGPARHFDTHFDRVYKFYSLIHTLKGNFLFSPHYKELASNCEYIEMYLERKVNRSERTFTKEERLYLTDKLRTARKVVGKLRISAAPLNSDEFADQVQKLCMSLGKGVCLEMSGVELIQTEKTFTAIQKIAQHLILNSLTHGIEEPADRIAKGKNPNGLVKLNFFRNSLGEINFVYSDDGRGIEVARVLARGKNLGLIDASFEQSNGEQLEKLIQSLIISKGFSILNSTTPISGRGLGLATVKEIADDLGSDMKFDSTPNKGFSVTLRFVDDINIKSA